jgi:hypothetical protein
MFAGDIRRQRVSRMRGFRHWRWHLDEMYVKLGGEMVYLWRGHCQTKVAGQGAADRGQGCPVGPERSRQARSAGSTRPPR